MAVDVTQCGQIVPAGAAGVLVADVDCSLQYGSYAVVLSDRATLRLNGFTLRSNAKCLGRCRITGPGEIAPTEPSCSGETVIDTYGVFAGGKLSLDDVVLTSWGFGTWAGERLRARGVQVSGQCIGLAGNLARLSVRDSIITNNLGLGVGGGVP
jgi:hypothetical protein